MLDSVLYSGYCTGQCPVKLHNGIQCWSVHRLTLSDFLDNILKPLCILISSYIRDGMDFLNHTPNTVKDNTHLVSFDVTSRYKNIPHNLGFEAID